MLAIANSELELVFAPNADAHNLAILFTLAVLWLACIWMVRHECACGRCEHCREIERHKQDMKEQQEHDKFHHARRSPTCRHCREGK